MSNLPKEQFTCHVNELLKKISIESEESIQKASKVMVEAIKKDAIIHVVGAGGHSQIAAFEFFYRAGGLANVSIMFPCGLGLFNSNPGLERLSGMGELTMACYNVKKEDVVFITSLYGMNAATIDLALAAKKRGATLVSLTSTSFSDNTSEDFIARHPNKKNLAELSDIVINSHTSKEETVIKIGGVSQKIGVASSIANCYAIQLLNIRICELCVEEKIDPPIWMSDNLPKGDETNKEYLKKYMPRMRHLYPYTGDFEY